ncbi:OTU-like cysteine protease [Seminavis robusta]|uniref:OTU-like cysteine protease n=1 Tax=Seminavis robusta TaxID=568900 RepID=A0A9N8HXK5_9STRA|nr:OTU-like cysteine protease [Seminavis robusta]|eukprot:Sro1823_g299920.1 OTU-like cysteine protease (419) ;mRNA; f:11704-12960
MVSSTSSTGLYMSRGPSVVLHNVLRVLLISALLIVSTFGDSNSPRPSIPRSTHNSHYQQLRQAADSATDFEASSEASSLLRERPPWNPSPQINDAGYCRGVYTRIPGDWETDVQLGGKHQNAVHLEMVQVHIRQVPGDGNCLFHSISTCMAQVVNGTSLQYPQHLGWLYRQSACLRKQAVDCLRQKRKTLFLQGHEYLKAQDLVEAAAAQYSISASEYCDLMQQDSYWGGGPEIVALSNVLKRPIHVYELAASSPGGNRLLLRGNNCFVLRRMACFGSPKFDKKEPFHILSADSRFPDISPGHQMSSGNHFLAVFPIPEQQAALEEFMKKEKRLKKKGKQNVRGGGDLLDEVTRKRMALEELQQRRRRQSSSSSSTTTTATTSKDRHHHEDESNEESRTIRSYFKGLWRRIFIPNHDD